MKIKILLTLASILLISCSYINQVKEDKGGSLLNGKPKNLILIIADGMGPQQLSLLLLYNEYIKSKGEKGLIIEEYLDKSAISLVFPKPEQSIITESACAATEIATGRSGTLEGLGINSKGDKLETILEKAKKDGKFVGLITDTRITHATPAAFAVHTPHRDNESLIAKKMLSADIDLMFGGGEKFFTPIIGNKSVYKLNDSSLKYQIVRNTKELDELSVLPALGIFASSEMMDGIKDFNSSLDNPIPKYSELSKKALKLLSEDKNGFFLMIEAGLIDWAGHRNDTGQLLYEMIKLNSVLETVLSFAESRSDTLVLLTADHETGSFGFSYKADKIGTKLYVSDPQAIRNKWKPPISFIDLNIFDTLLKQKKTLKEIMESVDNHHSDKNSIHNVLQENLPYKFTDEMIERLIKKEIIPAAWKPADTSEWSAIDDFDSFYPDTGDRKPALLSRLISEQQGTVWGTGGHTSSLVPLAIYGNDNWKKYFKPLMTSQELGIAMQQVFLNN